MERFTKMLKARRKCNYAKNIYGNFFKILMTKKKDANKKRWMPKKSYLKKTWSKIL